MVEKFTLGQKATKLKKEKDCYARFEFEYDDINQEQMYQIYFKNQKGGFIANAKSKVSFQKAADLLENKLKLLENDELQQERPLETLKDKIKDITKFEFRNKYNSRNEPQTYNGYRLVFSNYPNGEYKIEICMFNAGNTIVDFNPLAKNSMINNRGDIHINSANYDHQYVETFGLLMKYISDYLETDIEVREKELDEMEAKHK